MSVQPVVEVSVGLFAALCTAWVAWVGHRQVSVDSARLRLDSYNKMSEWLGRVSDFYNTVLTWRGSDSEKSARDGFAKAVEESRLLFPADPGISEILEEMHAKSFAIIGLKECGADIARCPQEYLKRYDEMQSALTWLNEVAMPTLTRKVPRYFALHDHLT
jgi:hypothetical protein